MSDVLKLDIKKNAWSSSIPYLAMWIVSIGLGFFNDWLIIKDYISITNSRKLWTSFGMKILEISK
jgi:MFS transporter, ACS family, solute carrier family 17 (sodium-dependent inorganic phosphate cotransporter), member 5